MLGDILDSMLANQPCHFRRTAVRDCLPTDWLATGLQLGQADHCAYTVHRSQRSGRAGSASQGGAPSRRRQRSPVCAGLHEDQDEGGGVHRCCPFATISHTQSPAASLACVVVAYLLIRMPCAGDLVRLHEGHQSATDGASQPAPLLRGEQGRCQAHMRRWVEKHNCVAPSKSISSCCL